MTGERVLVVDDSDEIRRYVVDAVLRPYAYNYREARDGQEALTMILSEPPDLVLLDLQLPRIDGNTLVKRLNQQNLRIPIVLMTSHGSEEIAIEMFRLGVRDYLIKPFDEQQLFDAMDRALVETRLRQERDDLTARLSVTNVDMARQIENWNRFYPAVREMSSIADRHGMMQVGLEAAYTLSRASELVIALLEEGGLTRCAIRRGGMFQIRNESEPESLAVDVLREEAARVGEARMDQDGDFDVQVGVPLLAGGTKGVLMANMAAEDVTEHLVNLLQTFGVLLAMGLDRTRVAGQRG